MNPSAENGAKGSSPWWMSPFWQARVSEGNAMTGFQMNLSSMEDGANGASPWWTSPYCEEKARIFEEDARISEGWRPRELEELMPDLPRDEQLRLQNPSRERRRRKKKLPPLPPSRFDSMISQQKHEGAMISLVLDALRHYNARHPGGEFDPVKPLMKSRVHFRGHVWFHINFWACSRTNNKMIRRFFAEIHFKSFSTFINDGGSALQKFKDLFSIVETCTIIDGPLTQYKRSCGFCLESDDIFHPKGCRKFVCGNDKDRFVQRLEEPRCCGRASIG